jgi:DNA-directed RNA polymerase specialized sigma54-like protein
MYVKEVADKKTEDELKQIIEDLVKENPKLKKQVDKDEKSQSKEDAEKEADKNESSDIDESSCAFYAMFADELGKTLRKTIIDLETE